MESYSSEWNLIVIHTKVSNIDCNTLLPEMLSVDGHQLSAVRREDLKETVWQLQPQFANVRRENTNIQTGCTMTTFTAYCTVWVTGQLCSCIFSLSFSFFAFFCRSSPLSSNRNTQSSWWRMFARGLFEPLRSVKNRFWCLLLPSPCTVSLSAARGKAFWNG